MTPYRKVAPMDALVVNCDYEPVHSTSPERACKMVGRGHAEVISVCPFTIRIFSKAPFEDSKNERTAN